MIKIILKGGLGNQLFQYARGRNLELSGKKIIFSTSFFNGSKAKNDTARNFKLDNFNIKTNAKFSKKNTIFLHIYNKIKRAFGFKQEEFWQNEKYFKNIEETIRKEFTLKNAPSIEYSTMEENIKNTENSVSVHIRRGDYIQNKKTNKILGVLPLDYYKKAITFIETRAPNPHLFIFSDDIEWSKNNLNLNNKTFFVSDQKIPDYEEMMLISKCKHNIIANSSFSWWGAWLNNNPNKIVIAPKDWFKNKQIESKEIIPSEWITI